MGERKKFRPPFLKEWRKHRGVTQERLAEQVGCSVALVSMIEAGKRQYDQEFLEAAAEALSTSPDRLLRINPLDPNTDDTIFEQVRRVPEADRAKLKAVLEAFIPEFKEDPAPRRAAKKKRRAG